MNEGPFVDSQAFEPPLAGSEATSAVAAATASGTLAVRNLVGAIQSSANRVRDLHGTMGIYFVFADLSVRTEGSYTLRLLLTDLGGKDMRTRARSPILAQAFTRSFEVSSAKKLCVFRDLQNRFILIETVEGYGRLAGEVALRKVVG